VVGREVQPGETQTELADDGMVDVMREASVVSGAHGAQLHDIDDPRAQAVCLTTTGTEAAVIEE
jgi:hypothetical protein